MENVEATGRTVDEAVAKALAKLGRARDEVEVTVLVEGTRGILGIGAEEARVRVRRREPEGELVGVARETLQRLLDLMDMPGQVTVTQVEEDARPPSVSLSIRGEYMGILIGRHGETLAALQFLLGLMINRRVGHWVRVVVDVEGYRERRERVLREIAYRAAERAQRYRQSVVMEPMIPSERRVIHLTLQDHPYVGTHSIGEGESRRVVVEPKH
ncbi:MAG: protein jag [Chloroflexi bacterium]|nr:protein jag [Chloroflexota bacterium]